MSIKTITKVINVKSQIINNISIKLIKYVGYGRVLGDLRGKVTCIQPNGYSTNDYIIAGQNLVPEIQCFKVMPIIFLSDHALIFTSIATNMKQKIA